MERSELTQTYTSITNTDTGQRQRLREETHSTTQKQRSYHDDSETEPASASLLEDTTRQNHGESTDQTPLTPASIPAKQRDAGAHHRKE